MEFFEKEKTEILESIQELLQHNYIQQDTIQSSRGIQWDDNRACYYTKVEFREFIDEIIDEFDFNTKRVKISEKYVWYASYGSNLLIDRLKYYIQGGICTYNGKKYEGCLDKRMPIIALPIEIPYQLYTAKESPSWERKGVAFLDIEKEERTLGRCYLVTRQQFDNIHYQEGVRWYDKEVILENMYGIDVITFTNSQRLEFVSSSDKYINLIDIGIQETYPEISLEDKQLYIERIFSDPSIRSEEDLEMVKYNNCLKTGIFDSWEIVSNKVIVKTMDKSVFKYRGSGIPKGTRAFWQVDDIKPGEKRNLKLLYQGEWYDAYIACEAQQTHRTRIFWTSKLQEMIQDLDPQQGNKFTTYSLMRFEYTALNQYRINFINEEQYEHNFLTDREMDEVEYFDGSVHYVQGKKYERNKKSRMEAIKYHGLNCHICNMNFEDVYGKIGRGFIEIHHVIPLHTLEKEMSINPKKDLIPLCANCHRMIHRDDNGMMNPIQLKRVYEYYKKYNKVALKNEDRL